ncbi:carcinine transporter-like [Ornithodoros turicata]|uniref:carcinine transporter-like n=1 Tax=Ornithodoros turicata TaxID=34597 RepID=UPI0031396992
MDFNSALRGVGDFGRYQKLLIAFLVVPSGIICALLYFAQYFIILLPEDYSCRIKVPEDAYLARANVSKEAVRALGLPHDPSTGRQHQCLMYDVNLTHAVITGTSVPNASWATVECQDGWEYDYGNLYPTIVTELDLVCNEKRKSFHIQLVFYMGTWIGSILFGFLADWKGRRWSIFISYLVALMAGIVSSFTKTLYLFMAFRFVLGMCIIPLSEDPFVLALEYTGLQHRTYVIVLWGFFYIVASALCPWIAYALGHWSYLSLATTLPLLIVVIFCRYIPESASWLLTRGRTEEAKKYLAMVAHINGREFPSNLDLKDRTRDRAYEKEVGIKDTFLRPGMRRHLLLNLAVWFLTYCGYHTNVYNTSHLGTDVYVAYTIGALLELIGLVFMLCCVDSVGRRWPMVVSTGVAGVIGVFSFFCAKDSKNVILALSLIMRVCLTTEYDIILQYSAEVFPTVLRGRCLALLRVGGTMSLFISPYIVYLSQTNPVYPMVICGVMCLVLSAISLFLPETMGQPMPQTLEESEQLGAKHKVLDCPCINTKGSGDDSNEESGTMMSQTNLSV